MAATRQLLSFLFAAFTTCEVADTKKRRHHDEDQFFLADADIKLACAVESSRCRDADIVACGRAGTNCDCACGANLQQLDKARGEEQGGYNLDIVSKVREESSSCAAERLVSSATISSSVFGVASKYPSDSRLWRRQFVSDLIDVVDALTSEFPLTSPLVAPNPSATRTSSPSAEAMTSSAVGTGPSSTSPGSSGSVDTVYITRTSEPSLPSETAIAEKNKEGGAPASKSKSNTPAIVGGVVGGLVALAALAAALWWFRRRHSRSRLQRLNSIAYGTGIDGAKPVEKHGDLEANESTGKLAANRRMSELETNIPAGELEGSSAAGELEGILPVELEGSRMQTHDEEG